MLRSSHFVLDHLQIGKSHLGDPCGMTFWTGNQVIPSNFNAPSGSGLYKLSLGISPVEHDLKQTFLPTSSGWLSYSFHLAFKIGFGSNDSSSLKLGWGYTSIYSVYTMVYTPFSGPVWDPIPLNSMVPKMFLRWPRELSLILWTSRKTQIHVSWNHVKSIISEILWTFRTFRTFHNLFFRFCEANDESKIEKNP